MKGFETMAANTPMMQQYLKIKAEYQDAFLFFRLGDFYEMFFEDAVSASQELEITLTSRGGSEDRIPMCGIPYHSAASYIDVLIERGYKVAICEQTEDPKQAKGVVRREVVQLITPGTKMDGKGMDEKENNYIASISDFFDGTFGFVYADLTTGESKVTVTDGSFDSIFNELAIVGAREVVLAADFQEDRQKQLKDRGVSALSFEDQIDVSDQFSNLLSKLHDPKSIKTTSRLMHYIFRTQKRSLDHLQIVQSYEIDHYMKLDYYSKINLELTETIRGKGKKGSLLWLLDETKTAMGGRMLKQWIDRPLIDKGQISHRSNLVETLIRHYFERQDLRERLKEVYDLERLAGRVAFGNVNARDLIQLKRSLQQLPNIRDIIASIENEDMASLSEKIDPCEELTDLLETSLVENPPLSIKEGNFIQDGFHAELDTYRDASRNGKTWIATLEREEREKTGIKSLKIGYNRVFGYYIEVTRANLQNLDDTRYERKQTLSNAERFITPELKEKEALILQAEENSIRLEYDLFMGIRERVKEFIPRLQALAKTISELDVLQSFATISEERHYVKPVFSEERKIVLQNGRHPVVEKVLQSQEYVPNDCYMDTEREVLLITGPNMSGKSTYMRQIALTSIMAQIGCYVPAEEAILPIFDKVFTRIGAADDLISGQSTFMVEMLEARNAITNATANSLILFDEIGRGTSTYDGMALAQAIIEYIHGEIGAKTLFSTHYHELTVLDEELPKLKNVHVSAIEQNGHVVFLHKIKEGPADKSYGIHVAKLAQLPEALINRANIILSQLEQGNTLAVPQAASSEIVFEANIQHKQEEEKEAQLSFFEQALPSEGKVTSSKENKVLEDLKKLEILDMTPLDALNMLYKLQKKLK